MALSKQRDILKSCPVSIFVVGEDTEQGKQLYRRIKSKDFYVCIEFKAHDWMPHGWQQGGGYRGRMQQAKPGADAHDRDCQVNLLADEHFFPAVRNFTQQILEAYVKAKEEAIDPTAFEEKPRLKGVVVLTLPKHA